ncbi:hypothetical protein [Effusibacillus consociatus]|uniref:DUF2335 domain-containing protein n=1 Tax=Effusibacillus consociatus TaxID=1117041 RepID=A0ABV9Q5S6_9BACL
MSDLREIVRRHVEEETLKQYLGEGYAATPFPEKQRLLDVLRTRGEIDREIRRIVNAYLEELEQDSPKKKQRFWGNIALLIVNLVCTAMISYAVNITNWPVVIAFSVVLLIAHLVNTYLIGK